MESMGLVLLLSTKLRCVSPPVLEAASTGSERVKIENFVLLGRKRLL